MSYRIKQKESMEESVQRIAREQTNKAIAELDDGNLDAHAAVDQAQALQEDSGADPPGTSGVQGILPRKRLVSRFGAALVVRARCESIIDTLDKLLDHFTDELDRPAFSPVRRRLTERRKEIMQDEVALHERLAEFSDRMREGASAWRRGGSRSWLRGCRRGNRQNVSTRTRRHANRLPETPLRTISRMAQAHEVSLVSHASFAAYLARTHQSGPATKSIGWRVSWGTTMICRSWHDVAGKRERIRR